MFSTKLLKKISGYTLLAFVLNATLPFYISQAAEASFNLSGGKALLCTVRGYQWVDLEAPVADNVIVIKSPRSNTTTPVTEHSRPHCALCFINPHAVWLVSSVPITGLFSTADYPPHHFVSIQNNLYQQQQLNRLAFSRAPPTLA